MLLESVLASWLDHPDALGASPLARGADYSAWGARALGARLMFPRPPLPDPARRRPDWLMICLLRCGEQTGAAGAAVALMKKAIRGAEVVPLLGCPGPSNPQHLRMAQRAVR